MATSDLKRNVDGGGKTHYFGVDPAPTMMFFWQNLGIKKTAWRAHARSAGFFNEKKTIFYSLWGVYP